MTGGTGGSLTARHTAEEPGCETGIHLCLQVLDAFIRRFGNRFGLIVRQQDRLRPSAGKVEPVRVLRVLGRNGRLQAVDELAQATGPVFDGGGSNADTYPGSGQVSACSCGTECSNPSTNRLSM
jgi:hypothetical protein